MSFAPQSHSVLRAPPFLRPRGALSHLTPTSSSPPRLAAMQADRLREIARRLSQARVGGAFWAATAAPRRTGLRVYKADDARSARRLRDHWLAGHDASSLWALLPDTIWARRIAAENAALGIGASVGEVDPWSILDAAAAIDAAPDSDLGLLAGLFGRLESQSRADGEALAFDALVTRVRYRCPFDGAEAACEDTIETLAEWRRVLVRNRNLVAAIGVTRWKRREIGRLLVAGPRPLAFRGSARAAVSLAARRNGVVAAWPSRAPHDLQPVAARAGVAVASIEDGFIRSVGLGSALWPPASIAVDRQRPHFDPRGPSDLETLLQETAFDGDLLARARRLIDLILALGVTKYNLGGQPAPAPSPDRVTVLVTGQVEDDLSFILGGGVGNLALLSRARELEPDARILFKPHPDVEQGHRQGRIDDRDALRFADAIVRDVSMTALFAATDRLHTVSSLSGFEALLRGRQVVTHGQPFYAGWGLTHDLQPVARRTRRLSLEELAAGALILYPRYIDPQSGLPCPPELLVRRLAERRASAPRPSLLTRLRGLQGAGRRWTGQMGTAG